MFFNKRNTEQISVAEFCEDRSLTGLPHEKLGTLGTIAKALTKAEHLHPDYATWNGKRRRTYPSHILQAALCAMEASRRLKK